MATRFPYHNSEESDLDIDGYPPISPRSGYYPRGGPAYGGPAPPFFPGLPPYYDFPPPSDYPPLGTEDARGGQGYPPPPGYMERAPLAGYLPTDYRRGGGGGGPPPFDASRGYPPPPYETNPGYVPRGSDPYDRDRGYPPPPGSRFFNPPPAYVPDPSSVAYPPPSYPERPPHDVYPPPGRPVNAADGFPPLPYSPTRGAGGPSPPRRPPVQQYPPQPPVQPYPPPPPPVNENAGFPSPPLPYNANAGYPPPRPGPIPPGAVPYGVASGLRPPRFSRGQQFRSRFRSSGRIWRSTCAGCRDYWAAILFVVHFWAVIGVCIYLGVTGIRKTNHNNAIRARDSVHALVNSLNSTLSPSPAPTPLPASSYSIRDWAPQLATAAGAAVIFAWIWQSLIRMFPQTMIYTCLIMGSVATGLLGIILISTGNVKGLVGLIFIAAALFQALFVQLVKARIPFATIMLKKVLLVTGRYPGLYFVSYSAVFIAMCWIAIWIFGAAGAVSIPYGGYYVALLIISLAWSIEVLRNTVNITVAGTVGTFYFQEHAMPRNPTLRALVHACTISFGSVCLGSLFVAIIQTLHAIAQSIANQQRGHEFLFSCVTCFLGILDNLIRYFNKWAFVQVAVHGKNFTRAARDTWNMFQVERVDVLINDDLTGAVLFTGCIVGGGVTALVAGIWTFATHRNLTVGIAIVSFFIGYFLMYLTMVVAESGVAAYYVCFAEDHKVLESNDPPLYQYMCDRKSYLEQQSQLS
ncbi:unnamed protein product [Sphagnum troendelagicum]|uniref:Choline transporter-like protein n=1 Tax=Sphagnum troendelagicum TaxID=128251 RepID=A0ABP0TA39_9BRYO